MPKPPAKKRDAPEAAAAPAAKKKPKAAKVEKLKFIVRADTPRVGGGQLKVISVNVAGLRSVLSQDAKLDALRTVVEKEQPDVLCVQEHKLQEAHVAEATKSMAELLPGYTQHWTCSTEKKGYSGVATFVKGASGGKSAEVAKKKAVILDDFFKKQPAKSGAAAAAGGGAAASAGAGPVVIGEVVPGMGAANQSDKIASNEGRLLTLELEHLYVVNAYVPNSGQKLERLAYRTKSWDAAFHAYLAGLEARKPVLLIGDLNVAYGVRDIHNVYVRPEFPDDLAAKPHGEQFVGLKSLLVQPGCTPDERDSFRDVILREGQPGARVDGLRYFHPTAEGVFTYWSQRAGNRPVNKGLRLDYTVVSASLVSEDGGGPKLLDSFVLDDVEQYPAFSDHAPMGALFSL